MVGIALLITRRIRPKLLVWAVSLVIAGGIGNMIDRIITGYVVDYIHITLTLGPLAFPYVFNIADICVVTGAALMFVYFILDIRKESTKKKSHGDETESSV